MILCLDEVDEMERNELDGSGSLEREGKLAVLLE